jgi:hypothetical protein
VRVALVLPFLCASVAAGLFSATASAQDARSTTGAETDSITLVLDLAPGTALDAEALRTAVARELGLPVTGERGGKAGTLVVREEDPRAIVSFDAPDGRHDGRSILLATDPAQAVRDIALLAGNVARDQAAQFALPAAPPAPAPPPPPPANPRSPSRAPRPAPCRATGTTLFAGVDFVPLAGVSTVDRGQSMRHLSLGVLGELSGGVKGAAVSGVLALDLGPLCGVQVAGIADVAADAQGAQIAGTVSIARSLAGAQIAGAANVTGDLRGVQVAGAANVAWEEASGVQIAPINFSGGALRGVQIGAVNYAQDADFQFGAVSINASGRLRVDAWSKPEMGLLFAGVKHGGRHYHWIYGLGARLADTSRGWAVIGVGAHVTPAEKAYVDVDLLDNVQFGSREGQVAQVYEARATVGYAVLPQVAVFIGPTVNVLNAALSARSGEPGYASHLTATSSNTFGIWPGATLGVEGL